MINWSSTDLATTLGIPKDNVRLVSPFIGGGFGGKLFVRADAVLAALGARAAGRPVKVALQRPLMINNTTHRPATIQRIRIGASADGKITAIGHESWSGDLEGGKPETAIAQTRLLYAGANRMTAMRLAVARSARRQRDARAGRGAGSDGARDRHGRDGGETRDRSAEFRILNDTQVDPEKPDRPFSERQLIACARTAPSVSAGRKRIATPGADARRTLADWPWARYRRSATTS